MCEACQEVPVELDPDELEMIASSVAFNKMTDRLGIADHEELRDIADEIAEGIWFAYQERQSQEFRDRLRRPNGS